MQGSLSCLLGDIPHAENELKVSTLVSVPIFIHLLTAQVAMMHLPGDICTPTHLVAALAVYTELARLYCHRKHYEEADKC